MNSNVDLIDRAIVLKNVIVHLTNANTKDIDWSIEGYDTVLILVNTNTYRLVYTNKTTEQEIINFVNTICNDYKNNI